MNIEDNKSNSNSSIRFICKIDLDLYKCASDNIITDEVVLTKKQEIHIRDENNRDVLDKYINDIESILNNPDYILDDEKNKNTVKVIKSIPYCKNKNIHIVLRLVVVDDNPNYKNSIITAWEISDKKLGQLIRNKTVLFSNIPLHK